MRIVIIDKAETTKIGGMGKYSERISLFFKKHGHEIFFIRYSNELSTDDHIVHIPYYIADPRIYILVPSEKSYHLIRDNVTRIKPDIVYAYIGLSPIDFLLPTICKKLHIPLTGIWHMDFPHTKTFMYYLIKIAFSIYIPFCRSLQLLVVFSQQMKNFHIKKGIDPNKIMTLSNGVDVHFFTPGNSIFAKKNAIKTGILMLGRLSFQKNPKALLNAFLSINPPQDTKLVLVGGGDMEQSLREKFQDPRIIFTGIITDNMQKRDIIRSCQIIVQPSLMEGVSLALLEAMSCGLSAITSDAGDNRLLLKNAGEIIPMTHLKNKLPKILTHFLHNQKLVVELGKHARVNILTHHSEEKIYTTLLNTFKQISL